MSRVNIKTNTNIVTASLSPEAELRRTVLSCLLFEKAFYESGESIKDRIKSLCKKVSPEFISKLAIEARTRHHLRHVPLLLCVELAEYRGSIVSDTIAIVIQRADEICELLALYWMDGKKPISNQLKKGLAKAFLKFDEYQFAKYNRATPIKLRDVMFLVHAKPNSPEKEELFLKIANDTLATPNTWEVQISATKGDSNAKRLAYDRLLHDQTIGDMALLRNIRNMHDAGVIALELYIFGRRYERVLPFRFISAARACPYYEGTLEKCFFDKMKTYGRLGGKTVILIDHSGSMKDTLSEKSEVTRFDAACGLAMILREICEFIEIYSFSVYAKIVPPRRGFELRDEIFHSNNWGGTNLYSAIHKVNNLGMGLKDRLIVITDEQATDTYQGEISSKYHNSYIVNVAPYQTGVEYGDWVRIDGFSEATINFIMEYEKEHRKYG